MKPLLLALLFGLSAACSAVAQPFEGFIEFTQTEGTVMTFFRYYVKGDNVRIEEINSKGKVQGIMLVNLKTGEQLAMNPMRKIYMKLPSKKPFPKADVSVDKTTEKRTIKGEDCTLWKVSNAQKDRVIHYHVSAGRYDFFLPLLHTIRRRDFQAVFFEAIPDAEGVFPMLGEEYTSEGTFVSRLEVTKLTRATIGDDLFVMPSDYKMFEH